MIKANRVRVNGAVERDAERRVTLGRDRLEVDGKPVQSERRVYVMLNKPRGLVTTVSDEQGRETVYSCLAKSKLPRVVPVGRLDKASEGLLLLTNDTDWANHLTTPDSHIEKTYHVQIDRPADDTLIEQIKHGVEDAGEKLQAKRVSLLRRGEKNSWLEITLDEGKNRHIRRMLAAHKINVLRLVRVRIGSLILGNLEKGAYRELTPREADELRAA